MARQPRFRNLAVALMLSGWALGSMLLAPEQSNLLQTPTLQAQENSVELIPASEPLSSGQAIPPVDEAIVSGGLPVNDLSQQSEEQALAKSQGCLTCHTAHDPHQQPGQPLAIQLGCCDCHGGNPNAHEKHLAHVSPRYPDVWVTSANPVRSYAVLNYELPEFIRFVNPGDLRIAHISCGGSGCHQREVVEVKKSMMTHGCMLWGAALYNNGAVPHKWSRYGESYSMHGTPQRLQTVPAPTPEETATKGVLPFLDPLPRFQVTQPGNVLRIFERGGRFLPEIGIPERLEEPGRPRQRLSNRGLGTLNRTDPVFIGLQKTRLLDPTLNFLGTNDHPGDYRSSGCTACHMIYANDRNPIHSGRWARYGNEGLAASQPDDLVMTVDPAIPKTESGHPIEHRFVTGIPSSQCMVCHIHPGTNVMNSYLGYMWWDLESDAEAMYPRHGRDPSAEELTQAQNSDPNEIAARGLWSHPDFLKHVAELNPRLDKSYFSDFHGHGWVFKAVFRKDRFGNYLDRFGNKIPEPSAAEKKAAVGMPLHVTDLYRHRDEKTLEQVLEEEERLQEMQKSLPVHMLDVHLEKGMHCVDCHFVQDVHGNTKLYGEVRAAIEITCEDCHGTTTQRAVANVSGIPKMFTTGPAATERPAPYPSGRDLTNLRTPFGKRRFEIRGDTIIQNSMLDEDVSWEITQVADSVDASHPQYNPLAALAKTVRFGAEGTMEWGEPSEDRCAHSREKISCIACHSSWNPSCFGCHLPQKANKKQPGLHNEGDVTRNHVSYNFQTLREDVYMLGKDGNVTGNRIGPARSSCAIHVTSYNQNRESIYTQQQTVSADGMSGIAFSTNVPHTVRGPDGTKTCTDCHLSAQNDNNAQMAQLLMQGTNFLNFVGRYCWIAAEDHGLFGVIVTERDEPQTVIGSSLHEIVYPERYEEHGEHGFSLKEAHEHPGRGIGEQLLNPLRKGSVLDVQVRGEYLYAACGSDGVRIFDIAFIDHKGFSERITTAPVSPAGQRFYVKTPYATSVAAPTTIAPDPTRQQHPENEEQPIHSIYGYIFATDLELGLILIGAGTLLDGNPTNNFVKAELTYNPNGLLNGAKSVTIVGTYAYVCCPAGLVVIDLQEPKRPHVVAVMGPDELHHPSAVEVQFRYAFVCDKNGLQILDVTNLANPVKVATFAGIEAHNVYVARNYAYVAAGREGLIILDVTNPARPQFLTKYDAHGHMNDVHDVKLGIYYASQYAFVADGHNGLRVLQLTSPETPGYDAFLPHPVPKLIATFEIPKGGHAVAVSEGLDRDRAVDESGNQIAVFGRVGARPLNAVEQRRLFISPDGLNPYFVEDARRDYTIDDPTAREKDLHQRLEDVFGPSQRAIAE